MTLSTFAFSCYSWNPLIGQFQLVTTVKITHLIGKIMTSFDSVSYYYFQPKISQWIDQVFQNKHFRHTSCHGVNKVCIISELHFDGLSSIYGMGNLVNVGQSPQCTNLQCFLRKMQIEKYFLYIQCLFLYEHFKYNDGFKNLLFTLLYQQIYLPKVYFYLKSLN